MREARNGVGHGKALAVTEDIDSLIHFSCLRAKYFRFIPVGGNRLKTTRP